VLPLLEPRGTRWQCRRCGSLERRPNGKGCAECHRRAANPRLPGLNHYETRIFKALLRDEFRDIRITRPVRAYLRAFDAFLAAENAGDTREARCWLAARHEALRGLEEP
jgi:hypothetical protein